MSVKIRLKRFGKIRAPFYRIVVADSRTKRDGRVIEEIGKYHPTAHPSLIEVDSERAQHWLKVGAQPTEAVLALLKLSGDWGRFTGEGSTESTIKAPEQKAAFEADQQKKPVLKPKSEAPAPKQADVAEAAEQESAGDDAAAESGESAEQPSADVDASELGA